jgi:hypothetical protein
MKITTIQKIALLAAALPLAAMAQTTAITTTTTPDSNLPASEWGPHTGSSEFTLGGNGSTNRNLDNSIGGATASYGYYFNNAWEGVIRQSLSYSNPQGTGGNTWTGETDGALDYQLIQQGPIRPFVGPNLGWIYGNHGRDTAAAGAEVGVKFYVMPRTFIYAMADYDWLFRHDKAILARSNTGIWNWSVGMGFNF